MNIDDANLLNRIVSEFYDSYASSFSSTRDHPWAGWDDVMRISRDALIDIPKLLDVGCGNLRFEDFALSELEEDLHSRLEVYAIDSCPDLHASSSHERYELSFFNEDICELLQDDVLKSDAMQKRDINERLISIPECSLVVCFGVMHHIPLRNWREELIRFLVSKMRQGGFTCISFWQFAKNEKLREKAMRATRAGIEMYGIELDPDKGDFFLGWQGSDEKLRYCHSFSDEEVDELVVCAERLGAHVVDDYLADGRTGDLNRYIIFGAD